VALTKTEVSVLADNVFSNTGSSKNRLMNGDYSVAQRGASFTSTGGANNDDTYVLDRWYVLSDGNDVIDVTQETSTVPTNQKFAVALDVETVNKKFGIAQIIENINCIGLIGGNVTLSFKAKVSSTTKLDNVKAAVVAWSGTADAVTSDIISAWNVEGTNPTLIANATYENTPTNLNLTTSYATYTVTGNVDTASTKNIIVFVWSDVTDTTLGDFLFITDVQLESGTASTPYERRSLGNELSLCQRYYYRSVANVSTGRFGSSFNTTTTAGLAFVNYPVVMRSSPTALEISGVFSDYAVAHQASSTVCSAVPTFSSANTQGAVVGFTVASGLTAGDGSQFTSASGVTTAFLGWSAEL